MFLTPAVPGSSSPAVFLLWKGEIQGGHSNVEVPHKGLSFISSAVSLLWDKYNHRVITFKQQQLLGFVPFVHCLAGVTLQQAAPVVK